MATVLITGTNKGIGLELARQFSARGDRVLAACRNPSPELEALGAEVFADVDVTSDASVAALARRLPDASVDLLINNAGILSFENLGDMNFDRMLRQFEVNSLGPLRVTLALLSKLADAAKVFIITSRMGSIGDNTSGGSYGYRASKAAANMIGMSLARDLAARGIAVGLLHPGLVATDMTGGRGIPPAESATGLIARIDGFDSSQSETFWHASGEALPW